MKLKITLVNGTVVEAEGTVEELEVFKSLWAPAVSFMPAPLPTTAALPRFFDVIKTTIYPALQCCCPKLPADRETGAIGWGGSCPVHSPRVSAS